MSMMDTFTKRAKRVLVYAQEEARGFKHAYIGTEHLLLGLIRDEGVAGVVLRDLGVEVQRARSAVEFLVGHGARATDDVLEQTASAKKVIEYALEEARSLNQQYVDTEHLLLGLVRKGEGVAAGVLEILGVRLEHVQRAVLTTIGGGSARAERTSRRPTSTLHQGYRSLTNRQPSQRSKVAFVLAVALGAAFVYITRLQRALAAARQRGDMYRDIAAELDRRHGQSA